MTVDSRWSTSHSESAWWGQSSRATSVAAAFELPVDMLVSTGSGVDLGFGSLSISEIAVGDELASISYCIARGGAQVEDNQEVEPIVIQGWARDNDNVFSGGIHIRQQVVVQDDVFVRGSGVVDELKMILQNSQVLNDQKLLEVVQYTHNHVSNTVANTEKRLERHVQDYLEGFHSQLETTSKQNMTLQASEIDRHFNCFVDDIGTRIKTSTETTSQVQRHTDLRIAAAEKSMKFAQEIEQRQMHAAINTNNATIESKLEKQLTASHNDTTVNVCSLEQELRQVKQNFSHQSAQLELRASQMEQKAAKPEALAEICLLQQELHEIKKLCIDQGARLSSRVSKLKKKFPKVNQK
ncbi:unnamed protein product [Phytophthora fragariaefolia]|uniref:Unnamed protein product n=1 Tax=Phytophthora fragariaefolia TaxID=1490495 RepID=A0A9W6Y0G2_9STRA|nr:unnamed protein product [Phytophthora fragariaefolia]